MDELVERVRQALAAEYPGAPNGRVRDLPDRRAIRWYTTTGLVDRPTGTRGRTALYGPRHLLQLVAVKRRQAEGHSLAAIQAELAGASDAELTAAARVPAELLTTEPAPEAAETSGEPPRTRFWATSAAAPRPIGLRTAADQDAAAPQPIGLRTVTDPDAAAPQTAAPRTAADQDAAASQPAGFQPVAGQEAARSPRPAPVPAPAPATGPEPAPASARELGSLDLGGGAILVLPMRPAAGDRADIADAARPLLDLLAARGLLTFEHLDDGSAR